MIKTFVKVITVATHITDNISQIKFRKLGAIGGQR